MRLNQRIVVGGLCALVACGRAEPWGFDAARCEPKASQHRFLKDGAEAFTVDGPEGDVCVVSHMREHAGTTVFEICRVPRTADTRNIPRRDPAEPLPGTCTPRP